MDVRYEGCRSNMTWVCDELYGWKKETGSRLTSEFYLVQQDLWFTEIKNIKGEEVLGGR